VRFTTIIWTAILLTAAAPALGDTIVVDHAGGGDYVNIQDGIDAASQGDTVLVLGGVYTGERNRDLDFGGTALRLEGSAGHLLTTIDCDGLGRGFRFHSGEDTSAVVYGVLVTNAAADSGAGTFCQNGSGPKFDQCIFADNHASVIGGGLCTVASSPVLRGCYLDSNTSSDGGLRNAYGGGAAFIDGSVLVMSGTQFVANQTNGTGGGVYARQSQISCASCEFHGNQVTTYGYHGAGVYLQQCNNSDFADCMFVGNGGLEAGLGAGLNVNSSAVSVTGCSFLNNLAGSAGGARVSYASSTCVFDGCSFAGNVGTWNAAGGIQVLFDANVLITKCTFVDNGSTHIWCQQASPDIIECILAFSRSGPPVNCDEGTETPLITHCILFGNAGGDDLCGGNHYDNAVIDPAFCDVWGYDLTLCEDSPCLPGLSPWGMPIGALGQGCPPCGTTVESTTWGGIKAMYR